MAVYKMYSAVVLVIIFDFGLPLNCPTALGCARISWKRYRSNIFEYAMYERHTLIFRSSQMNRATVTIAPKNDMNAASDDDARSLFAEMKKIPAPETRGTNPRSLKLISSVVLMLLHVSL